MDFDDLERTRMLTPEQQSQYLKRLGIEEAKVPTPEFLDELVYAHQTHVPFETIGVHRGDDVPNLDLDDLFTKVVAENKGGYCFELNKLFEALLVSLGFDAFPVLSRAVRGREGRMPINHRGVLIRFGDSLRSADVGFGGPMPAGSILLKAGLEQDINGETFITEDLGNGWWSIDRITKAGADLHDDNVPARRQTELELCTAPVEDLDFDSLNLFCAQPGTLFRDHDVVNLRIEGGYKGYKDGVLTLRQNGEKTVLELNEVETADALKEHFGLEY